MAPVAAGRNMRYRLILIIAVGSAFVVIAVVSAFQHVDETYRNYSALSVTETFLRFHLKKSSEPHFPESWASVVDEYEVFCDECQTSIPLDELRRRVTINWSAGKRCLEDPAAVNEQSAVITLADGSTMRWHGDDPNANIIRFMRELQRTATGK